MTDEVRRPDSVVIDGVEYRRGDKMPFKKPKLKIAPAFTGAGTTSFKPARKDKR